ncbi:dihydrolipoyl dehydrogenase [bacterium]|nr:dihydrolipoyl dehydrogenase [bacterium]
MDLPKNYDIAIIGAGPGGYVAAIRASQMGGKVVVIEKDELGGTCLNRGCIPTKALLASARLLNSVKKGSEFGIKSVEFSVDFSIMTKRKERIVKQLVNGIAQLFKSYGIELIKGEGRLTERIKDKLIEIEVEKDDGSVEKVIAKKLIVATGSVPAHIPGISIDERDVITSDQALELEEIPSSLLIVGGGVIGVEFASIFNSLGSKVTIVELLPRIIPTEDGEISEQLKKFLVRSGVEINTGVKVRDIVSDNGKQKVIMETAGGREEKVAQKVLIATGRRPYTERLGLEKTGIRLEKGRILVNERMETNLPGIFAIGDVVGGVLLAHVASAEGIVASENAMGNQLKIDYRVIPNCIYSIPEVASVGLSEERAREMGYEVSVGRFPFLASAKATILGERIGMVKIVADRRTDEILGIHIVGPDATELIGEASLAIKARVTTKDLERMIHAHPTLSEAIFEAAHDVHGEAIDLSKK